MSKIEHIDDLFKSKLAGREVEFDPAAWESAGAVLDKHYAGLFWKKFFGIFIPLLIVGSTVALWLMPADTDSNVEAVVAIEQSDIVLNEPSKAEHVYATSDETAAEDQRSALMRTDEDLPTSTHEGSTLLAATSGSTPSAPRGEIAASPAFDAPSVSHSEQETSVDEQNIQSPALANLTLQAEHQSYLSVLRPMPAFGLPHMNMVVQDTLADAKRPHEFLNRELRKMVFGVEGGLVLAHGYLNGLAKRERPGIGWHASVQADYHVYPRVYLATGVGLIARGSLANDAAFRLGVEDVVVQPIQAVFLNIPLTVNYRLGARQNIGIGMQYNPLLTAWGTRTSSIAGESSGQPKYVLDKTGLASFDMAAVLDYSCGVSERTSLTLHAQYGLFDMTDNLPTSRVDDYNYVLRVGVSYMLLSRVK